MTGVGGGTRTRDSRIKSAVLCQLSYADAVLAFPEKLDHRKPYLQHYHSIHVKEKACA
jgi:hypothetical protein